MFQLALCLLLVILLIVNFNKGFIITLVFSTWLSCFSLFGQSMIVYLSAIITTIFILKNNIQIFSGVRKFPLIIPFILMSCSWIITNAVSSVKHTPIMISYILTNVVIVYIAWYQLRVNRTITIKRFLKFSLIYGTIISCYSLFETITQTNPVVEFFNNINAYTYERIITEIRFGFKRSQSIFPMHTTNGAVSMMLFLVLFYAYKSNLFKHIKIAIIPIYLLAATVFLTGARSVILGFIISLFSFIKIKDIKPKHMFLALFSLLVIFVCFNEYLNEIFLSFLDTERVNGSNADMRSYQFELAFLFLNKSFLFGNGIGYTFESALSKYDGLFGAESLWIPIIIDQGFLGILAYIAFFISLIIFCTKNKCKEFIFIVIGFLVTNSMSSLPNFSITYIFVSLVIMVLIKKNNEKPI